LSALEAERTWLPQEAVELQAVALARTGAAEQALARSRSFDTTCAGVPLRPPSIAAHEESRLRRAEGLLAAVLRDEAEALLDEALLSKALLALEGQHRGGPRLRLARQMRPGS
jgi:hypothetical protein